jgi:hypothetical protein
MAEAGAQFGRALHCFHTELTSDSSRARADAHIIGQPASSTGNRTRSARRDDGNLLLWRLPGSPHCTS